MRPSAALPFRATVGRSGFSLVELMIALTIFGVVATSMYSVYLGMQRTSNNQDEVTDLQQSLRLALEIMGRDIHMAGLLSPSDTTIATYVGPPVIVAADNKSITINTAAENYNFARIAGDSDITLDPGSGINADSQILFPLESAEMADHFNKDDHVVIIRPQLRSQPFLELFSTLPTDEADRVQTVAHVDRAGPTITLKGFKNLPDILTYVPGDIIVRSPSPTTINWSVDADKQLIRTVNGVNQVIAEQVSNLKFSEATDSSGTTTTGVNILITADTNHQMDQTVRQRSVSSFFAIRN